ncbi:MAG: hypothetical protein KC414_03720, partial [Romboutsia sp.]|nr:hypothetical protein [Romboutsia sp.]
SFKKQNSNKFKDLVKRLNKNNSYPKVIQQYKDSILIREYNSIVEASNLTKIKRRAINNCLKGWSNSSGGFEWKYKND